jgi:hypothetical protein
MASKIPQPTAQGSLALTLICLPCDARMESELVSGGEAARWHCRCGAMVEMVSEWVLEDEIA